ncbi:MAG: hypothetical protein CL526_00280 [Aequorivita sp.]|nr:hypothetical protein [Aequorivita sp.]|tara:strand:+ start:1506 stop:1781 length:276 start_codon:yes stop_codon:yes gene_type:complete
MASQEKDENLKYKRSYIESQKTQSATKTKSPKNNIGAEKKPKIDGEPSFFERWETSRFWLIRAIFVVVRSVWMVVMVIGGFIVWLISLLFI